MPKDIDDERRRFLAAASMTVVATHLGIIGSAQAQPSQTLQLSIEGELPSLGSATAWLNSRPLTAAGLRGKVVLIDFWTYTCINWLRSLPYVRAWAARYEDHGLVVIGVHAPDSPLKRTLITFAALRRT
jgi:thiol-disulfide isomerase/thioredoxin